MPRKPRLHYAGALYHVIARGNNRQETFLSPLDYQFFIKILKRLKNISSFQLYAYCLMPNHIHLLVEVGEVPLSIIMQRLLTTYTHYFNRTHKRKGHLFQGRYKAIICDKDSYLLELVRYIHLNPCRAGLVISPSEWKWSGHQGYAEGGDTLLDASYVLDCLSQRFPDSLGHYMSFIRDGLTLGHKKEYYPEEKKPYLGSAKFIEEHRAKHTGLINTLTPREDIAVIPLREILKKVSSETGIEEQVIQSSSRMASVVKARKTFIIQALRKGNKAADIARHLNCSPTYITYVQEKGNAPKVIEVIEA